MGIVNRWRFFSASNIYAKKAENKLQRCISKVVHLVLSVALAAQPTLFTHFSKKTNCATFSYPGSDKTVPHSVTQAVTTAFSQDSGKGQAE